MSESKSKYRWISTFVELGGIFCISVFVGVMFTLATFTALETVVDTRGNTRRLEELERKVTALEGASQAATQASAPDTTVSVGVR